MESLYTGERAAHLARQKKIAAALCLGVFVAGFVTCIVLCTMVRTINARPLLIATISVGAGSGWLATMLFRELYRPVRAEADHVRGILRDAGGGHATEEYTGALTVSPMGFAIPKSIVIRKVKLTTDDGEVDARVDQRLLARMPKPGSRVRVRLIRGYVTAVEVCDEA